MADTSLTFDFSLFLLIFGIMLLAEFGDKTQLLVISLSAKFGQPGKVAAGATLVCKGRYRTTVVMAAQTLCTLMGSEQGNAGLVRMIEVEICTDLVPAAWLVTE